MNNLEVNVTSEIPAVRVNASDLEYGMVFESEGQVFVRVSDGCMAFVGAEGDLKIEVYVEREFYVYSLFNRVLPRPDLKCTATIGTK